MRTYIIGNDGIALCRKTPAKPVKAPPLLNCAFSNVQLHKDVGDCCLGEKRCNRRPATLFDDLVGAGEN